MKELLLGILLIILIGVGGFLYRNAMQSPVPLGPLQRACTEEAKICPDGSAVGRIGPSCEFQECPTSTIPLGTTPEMFVAIPQGYVENENINRDLKSGGDMTIQRAFEKPSLTEGVPHAIVLRQLSVTSEDGIEDDIVRNTIFETSDRGAESIDQFEKRVIGGRTYYVVTVERFEAQIPAD
jgi:hypothetical protein